MEIKYSFKTNEFGNNITYILEVKYLNLPAEAPKSEKFKWFKFSNNDLTELYFEEMLNITRKFKCGIFLDIENLKLNNNGDSKNVLNCDEGDNSYLLNMLKS